MQGIRDCAWVEQRSSHARKLLLCIRKRTVGMGDEDRGQHWQSCDSATIRVEQLGMDVPQDLAKQESTGAHVQPEFQ
jgi:hypothetical protein